jgi:pimeloyl-ACP methyl ester carboxylesterase
VHAVTLPGLAERAAEATPEVDVDTHIADLVRLIEDRGLREVVVVAHSGANMPVTGVADRIPERLARLVYVDTGPMPSGMAQDDFNPPEVRAAIEKRVAEEGGGWLIPPPFDGSLDPSLLTGLSEEQLAGIQERATPQPYGTATQPLVRPEHLPDVPKTLVATTFPLAAVEQLAASGNPAFSLMTGPDWTHRELPTSHLPMFSRPKELAAILADV